MDVVALTHWFVPLICWYADVEASVEAAAFELAPRVQINFKRDRGRHCG